MLQNSRFHFILPVLIAVLLLLQCTPPHENVQTTEKWSSADPLSVNFRVREQKFEKGNLIYNPSFEIGKTKPIDSITLQIKLDGWELIGNDVRWVRPNNDSVLDNPAEVYSLNHSICIHRAHADETEEMGQGVLSDYIKVIPGNYQLDFYVNLKNIQNPKSRLGTRIYDAVDIRVLYFDKNKLTIKGDQYAHFYDTRINTSFKGISFSNFEKIDSTGWLHIAGQSQLFPYPDGDLPDQTKFVRIFLGLKGTGTLWVDNVSYIYSRWNLTTLERISPYFDSTFTKNTLIIPQPKKIEVRESKIYFHTTNSSNLPRILVPQNPDIITLQAARELDLKIKGLLAYLGHADTSVMGSLISNSETEIVNAPLIFSIGATNTFNKRLHELPVNEILGQGEGYFIYTLDALSNIVFIYGNNPIGTYYASQSAIQLFDRKRLLFHNANVIDYPSNKLRGLLLSTYSAKSMEFILSSNKSRFNEIYLPIEDRNKIIESIIDATPLRKYLYTNDVNQTLQADPIFGTGFVGITFLENSPLKEKISLTVFDNLKDKSIEPIQENKSVASLDNSTTVERSPYLTVWCADGLNTWTLDETDLLIDGHFPKEPVSFADFTLFARSSELNYFANDSVYPFKLQTSCLFEPYSNQILPEVYQKVIRTIVAYQAVNIFDKIRLQTASDFLWNPENYDPDISLYRALVSEFGAEAAQKILIYNDLYFKIKSELIQSGTEKNKHKYLRKANGWYSELKLIQEELNNFNHSITFDELNALLLGLTGELEIGIKQLEKNATLNKNY